LPHEIGHVLQYFYGQVIKPDSDDGWLAEHDPSVIAMNLLRHALDRDRKEEEEDEEDGLRVPGLFETVMYYLENRVQAYHGAISEEEISAYSDWKMSCGCIYPEAVDSASIASDYLKIRAAVESYPVNLRAQLAALFERRDKDIRTHTPPPLSVCHACSVPFASTTIGRNKDVNEAANEAM
jgi:hypothetical protein